MPKLLLADDSVTIQRVIELTFADENVQILTAGDGEEAVARIRAERPDIVLADIAMPKRNGYDVAAFVKGTPELSHIPVLLLTGAFEPVDEARAQAVGCDGVLVKPFEPQHVIGRVRELLQRRAGHDASPPPPPRSADESTLDDYFDRLDAAFANMGATGGAPARPPEARRDGPVRERDLDWFDSPPGSRVDVPDTIEGTVVPEQAPRAADPVPVTFASPPGAFAGHVPQPPPIEPADAAREIAPQPSVPSSSRAAPEPAAGAASAIADAFAALLAAEQGEPDAPPVRLAALPSQPPVTEELVEAVAGRVMERLGAKVAGDLVADVVSRVAERLVREEIDRIRSKQA